MRACSDARRRSSTPARRVDATMSSRARTVVAIALAGLCAGALLVDRSLQFFIGRDSSVFLYVARRVQEGGGPYRDVWDHKPPLIYYLDVIGLALADRGVPGVAGGGGSGPFSPPVLRLFVLFPAPGGRAPPLRLGGGGP